MRRIAAAVILLLIAGASFADKKPETIEELKARAEKVKLEEQVKLFIDIAQRQLDAADKAYEAGDAEKGKAAIADVGSYGERAGEAAIQTGKRLKRTEIDLRKIGERLEAMRRSLSFEDRPPLQEAGDRLEKTRSRLLDRMFQGKGK